MNQQINFLYLLANIPIHTSHFVILAICIIIKKKMLCTGRDMFG